VRQMRYYSHTKICLNYSDSGLTEKRRWKAKRKKYIKDNVKSLSNRMVNNSDCSCRDKWLPINMDVHNLLWKILEWKLRKVSTVNVGPYFSSGRLNWSARPEIKFYLHLLHLYRRQKMTPLTHRPPFQWGVTHVH
jgi:hypothetical protein